MTRLRYTKKDLLWPLLFVSSLVMLQLSCDHKKPPITEDPDSGPHGWAAGSNVDKYGTIIHTADGGRTWVRQGDAHTIPDASFNDVCAIDKDHVWVVGQAVDGFGTILKTSNGGTKWDRLGTDTTLPDLAFTGVSAVNKDTVWVVGDSGVILKTTNGGKNWTRQKHGTSSSYMFDMISAVDVNHAWAVGAGDSIAVILHTFDGGNRWHRQGLDSLKRIKRGNGLLDVHAVNRSEAWTVGRFGQVLFTLNGGKKWTNKWTKGGFLHNNGVCTVGENIVWVASDDNNIYRLNHIDSPWVQQRADSAASAMYMGITAMDSHTAWIVTWSYMGGGQVLSTNNPDSTWKVQQSPVDAQFRKVSFAGASR